MRRSLAFVVLAVALWGAGGITTDRASAHAGLRRADPPEDAVLAAPPTAVELSFSEEPEPSLSSVRVVDETGAPFDAGSIAPVPGDPSRLTVPLRPLDQRGYTVVWRVVSRVDGHTTAGAYTFGVGVAPTAEQTSAAEAESKTEAPNPLELGGRWAYLVGLVLLLGAASGAGARFAPPGRAATVAGLGCVLSVVGLAVLTEAQRQSADGSITDLWSTAVGRATAWRACALVAAVVGVALMRRRRIAAWPTLMAAAAGIGVHVGAGHAAGGSSSPMLDMAAQWGHFIAAGMWVGGLATLVAAVRGDPSADKAAAVRRFSAVALVGVAVVAATGVARAVGELASWGDLVTTTYGQAVLIKTCLLAVMVVLGFRNRRRSVPAAATDLRPLRRWSSGELTVGAGALALAAFLAASLPPADAVAAPTGIVVSGSDFARSVRVRLTMASALPGTNRFSVRVVDYDSGRPVQISDAHLRFTAVDEPTVPESTLALDRVGEEYTAAGVTLSVDGRWLVTVVIERDSGPVSVPLEVRVRGAAQFLSVERTPGRPIRYIIEAAPGSYVRLYVEEARPGLQQLHLHVFDDFGEERALEGIVLTVDGADGRARAVLAPRTGPGRFVADVPLHAPTTPVAVVARAVDGTRLRAAVDIEVQRDR